MVHHDHKRRGLVRKLHGDGQKSAPIRKEGLALVREEEMLIVRIQIRRQSDGPERFAHCDHQILGTCASSWAMTSRSLLSRPAWLTISAPRN